CTGEITTVVAPLDYW
nr:immunoglobulin heavy chain junction region [Mus musculus]